ncbi:hypothetical protein [Symmachiella dynata]|uniref:hypothetical protein n=1 Tax=Symmachiella dynata TaxID=2527995 RepID=UPI00119CE0EA|nr:hypothetical protein [Symmachiella dynata]
MLSPINNKTLCIRSWIKLSRSGGGAFTDAGAEIGKGSGSKFVICVIEKYLSSAAMGRMIQKGDRSSCRDHRCGKYLTQRRKAAEDKVGDVETLNPFFKSQRLSVISVFSVAKNFY